MDYEDWRETLEGVAPLRMSHVANFLHESGRPEKCPFCSYSGVWDFHIRWPDSEPQPDDDPLMSVFELNNQHNKHPNECVAITCPQCAHFSLLDVNRIKMHIVRQDRLKEKVDG